MNDGRPRGDRHAGLALVERLNVAIAMGLPVAIAAYFCAKRLLSARTGKRSLSFWPGPCCGAQHMGRALAEKGLAMAD